MKKKILALFMSLLLMFAGISSVPADTASPAAAESTVSGSAEEAEIPDLITGYSDDAQKLVGGWSAEIDDEMTERAKKAFENAADLDGVEYEFIALIGTQVVAGTNYCCLAKRTLVTREPVTDYVLLYIYENLEGSAQITGSWKLVPGAVD